MPDKRKSSMPDPSPKRLRVSNDDESDGQPHVTPQERPRNNPIYGQKSAFPGLDDGGDELFYGPADDGLEYLRMVRSEASSLPSLFVIPTPIPATDKPDLQKDTAEVALELRKFPVGFFEDEAYIAPVQTDQQPVAAVDNRFPDAQISYYNLLRHRFLLLRSTLRCTPPATAIAALDDAHPISLPRQSNRARKEWRRLLLEVDPQMVQLACMDLDSVLRVLSVLARELSENVRSGNTVCVRRTGAWAWGLLGKCRDVGELATDQVGEVRNLGKRAAKILQKISEKEKKQSREEGEASDSDAEEDEAENESPGEELIHETAVQQDSEMPDAVDFSAELEAAKLRLRNQLQDRTEVTATAEESDVAMPESHPESGDALEGAADVNGDDEDEENTGQQARALLDMIITIVGEFFGQRDLLDAREVWTSEIVFQT
ncbi:hypothetical protein N7462_002510 [Penicillium macrosclerotiorum]|uniref:uncharacterized protein n=1 Tax=Penicillium macrosclerotiorum TaxID=303699 RepID=UPI002547553D|nr:uncharacterized protein N7462_002510 [Penicillium macrosclerotiorum]KAJ5693087.1 hypothetical protein N7462_002510 [Penicillium macrosclerotiorum]